MEELKPVPPAPKKKPSLLLRLLAFLLTLVLLLGAVALVAFRDRINLDAVKRYFTYRSLEREDTGQAAPFQVDSSGRGGFSNLGEDLLVWSSAGVRLYSPAGVEYISESLSFARPMADVREEAAVVYDAGGTVTASSVLWGDTSVSLPEGGSLAFAGDPGARFHLSFR